MDTSERTPPDTAAHSRSGAKSAVVFLPQNPYPPKSGFHQRCLQIITLLEDLGFRVTLLARDDEGWDQAPVGVVRYKPNRIDEHLRRIAAGIDHLLGWVGTERSFYQPWERNPPMMRYWFRRAISQLKPDVVVVSYSHWASLVPYRHTPYRSVMDMLDLSSVNRRMWSELSQRLPPEPIPITESLSELTSDDFFDGTSRDVARSELRGYERFDVTLAITPSEADVVREATTRTRVEHIPMWATPTAGPRQYDGPALFPTGPNPFNVQGYLYFLYRVLPLVREEQPDFMLDVTGTASAAVTPVAGVRERGFIPDLETLFEHACMVICPVLGGTGQKVKIIEAMAAGLPVVAHVGSADGSPIRHGVNGFVVSNPRDFAAHVAALWRDRDMCARIGTAARNTISAQASREIVGGRLHEILCPSDR